MSSNSSWVPNEDPQTLFSERSWLQGVVISAIAYGITVSLYFLSLYLLVREKNRTEFKKRLPLLIYITVSFLLGTFCMIKLAAFTQMAFIDDRNYPGGPNAFENDMDFIPIYLAGSTAYAMSNWLSDALVVWRFKVVYQSCRVPIWIVMFFPCLMLAGSVALGTMCLIQDSDIIPYVNNVNFTLPYAIITLALNVILTIAIALRLMSFRYSIVSVMGPNYGICYTSIAAMIIESAALFSAVAITYVVLFGIGNAVSHAFLQPLTQFQTIATLLIVFRVAQGKGWTEKTATCIMADWGSEPLEPDKMQFASPGTSVTVAGSGGAVKNTGREFQDSQHILKNFSVLRDVA